MARQIVDLDLLRKDSSLSTIANSIYGSVIKDEPANELGSQLCCVKKGSCSYIGEASEWVPHVLNNDGKGNAQFVTINGTNYVVKSISTIDRFSSFKDKDIFNIADLRKSMVGNPKASQGCIGVLGTFKYKYIGLDNFATEVINSAIIDEAFVIDNSLPKLYNQVVSYSLCGRAGLILMEQADQTDLVSFLTNLSSEESAIYSVNLGGKKGKTSFAGVKRDIILPLVKQVLVSLDFLQRKVEFIHSELIANNVLVNKENCRGNYNGVKLDGSYMAKIADYSHCSCSISLPDQQYKVRVFNEYRVTRFLPVTPSYEVKPKSQQVCSVSIGGRNPSCKDVFWWTLPSSFNVKTSLITQHSGMPFYRSYDAYVFMISLMLCPKFYYTIMSSENVDLYAALWQPLWMPKELEKVNKLIEKNKGEKISLSLVLDIIAGFSLRCDALDVLLENLKSI